MSSANDDDALAGRAARFRAALSESPPLLWSFLYFFCLLSGYYVLRPVRDAMGASSEVEAVFPPEMIGFFAAHDIPLKEVILQGQDASLGAALALERKALQILFATRDKAEGMAAFLEKRRPVYSGE